MKIAAVFGKVGTGTPHSYVEQMCRAQVACDWHSREIVDVSCGAIGVVRTSESFGRVPMLLRGSDGNLLAISGVPIKDGHLKEFLQSIVSLTISDAAKALQELGGAYAALYWNASEEAILLSTDFAGFQPVYLHRAPLGIAAASEIKAFSIAKIVPVQPDPAGWGAFYVFGHTVGESTQLAGVTRPRGVTISYKPASNTYDCSRNWNWPEKRPELTEKEVPIESIVKSYRKDVASYQEYGVDEATLLMSSGFDSRFILGVLMEAGLPISTLSVQQPRHYFGAEGKLGQKIAKKYGVARASLCSSRTGIDDMLASLRFVIMNDVSTPGLSLFIGKVAAHVCDLSGAVWEGLAPGQALTQLTDSSWESYLRKRGLNHDSDTWRAVSLVFREEFVEEMKQKTSATVSDERGENGEDDFGLTRFIFRNRALNRIAPNPLKVYTNTVIPFNPGLSKDIWEKMYCFSPSKVCLNIKVIKKILGEFYPESLPVPFCTEKGLATASGKFDAYVFFVNLIYGFEYMWERRGKMPIIGRLFRSSKPLKNDWLDLVHSSMVSSTNEIRPEYIERVLSQNSENIHDRKARNTFVYYMLWKLVMQGELSPITCEKIISKNPKVG